jgi:23S rRNA (pseudouridine1915-N3)-methyltransferase
MPFKVAVVGRPRDRGISSAITEYQERACRYWPLSFQEIRVAGTAKAPPAVVRRKEADRLLAAVPDGARLVACDERGTHMTSRDFADWLITERDHAGSLTFLIGGAFGFDEEIRTRATVLLSLSRFTLPHELARLLLTEQFYRAGTIMRGEPYHK